MRTAKETTRWRAAAATFGVATAILFSQTVVLPKHALSSPPVVLDDFMKRRSAVLDALFGDLKIAQDQNAADQIVAKIWDQWMLSGRDDVDTLLTRVVASMAGRHFGLALLLAEEVIDLMPQHSEAWNKRATIHYHMGRYDLALADIERTLELEPRHFGALAGRAAIHADKQNWKDALEAYRAALAINPFLQRRSTVLPELERKAGERAL